MAVPELAQIHVCTENLWNIIYFTSEYTSLITLLLDILPEMFTQEESSYPVKKEKPNYFCHDEKTLKKQGLRKNFWQ